MALELSPVQSTLTFEGPEAIKSIATQDGHVTVGAYAIRFSGPGDPDTSGEYFTPRTNFGPKNGDGVATLFHHGLPIKGLERLQEIEFGPATTRRDETGIFAETTLDLSDPDQARLAHWCAKGALKWSSGSASHLVRKGADGCEITRWHPIEFSFTPAPVDERLPAIRPLKSLPEIAAPIAAALAEAFAAPAPTPAAPPVDTPKEATPTAPTKSAPTPSITVMEKTPEQLEAEQNARTETAVKARELAIEEITALGEQYHCMDAARSFIRDRKSAGDFQKHILTDVLKAKPVKFNAGLIGMDQKELGRYSFLKAVREFSDGFKLTGLEKEVHDAAVKATGRKLDGRTFVVAQDIFQSALKAQNVTTATAGGFMVQNDYLPPIELLRNRTAVMKAGATMLGGLVGDVIIPVQTGASVSYWVAETGALTDSELTFGQKKLTPHRLGVTIPYSTQWRKERSPERCHTVGKMGGAARKARPLNPCGASAGSGRG
jgi:hypothetical protein